MLVNSTHCINAPAPRLRAPGARLGLVVAAVAAVQLGAGCQVQQLFPNEVGNGAARLTVRNSMMIVGFVNDDENCGFASPGVQAAYRQDGELGSVGKVTWTVEDCAIDLGDTMTSYGEDCIGAETTAKGMLRVSAAREVEGILTGNPEQPVIPMRPDAVHVQIRGEAKNYLVRFSNRVTGLEMKRAKFEIDTSIHLAAGTDGICRVPTSDATLNGVHVKDAVYEIDTGDKNLFTVDVPQLDIDAQVGTWGETTNVIHGDITVWDTKVSLAGDDTLDTDYDAQEFVDAYSCDERFAQPIAYTCRDLTPDLADGAAKLTVNNVGNLVSVLSSDTTCGFGSMDVIHSAELSGTVGHDGGEALMRIDTPCTLAFSTKTVISRDCAGKTTYAEGSAQVTGTMRIRGRLTGNPDQPIIPTHVDAVEINVSAAFDHWKISDDASDQSLEILNGNLSGRIQPRMAIDTSMGACSIATPVVTFEDLAFDAGATAILRTDGNALRIAIDGSSLDAQAGKNPLTGDENKLYGSMIVEGRSYPIPLDAGAPVLDPGYDAAAYQASFTCKPNMALAADDAACDFHQVIGDGIGRLAVQAAGTIASMINSNETCGFEDTFGVLLWPSDVQGDVGEMGSLTHEVEACAVGQGDLFLQSTDCLGGKTFVGGTATVTASRTVLGERDTEFLVADSIIPRAPESVTLTLTSVALSAFTAYAVAAGAAEPLGVLTLHDGTLSAVVEPILGENADEPGRYEVATPIARISHVAIDNAHATLVAQGMTFEIFISHTDINALNGAFGGASNDISGSVTFDGDTITLGGDLNPDYTQGSFDAAYACTENLRAVF